MTPPVALTIAGSDPSGGAGLQADLKTFHQHGVYGMSVVALLTVQNTRHVEAVQVLDPRLTIAQLDALLADIPPRAAKTGALGSAAMIEALADRAAQFTFPLVVDPVMLSKHGDTLLPPDAVRVLQNRLLRQALLVTPNIPEAAALAEMAIEDVAGMEKAAAAIAQCGVRHVLIKGGRLPGTSVDVLYTDGEVHRFAAPRVETDQTHGSGCVFSAAITARLARGEALESANQGAKAFITAAIRTSPKLGGGCGPVNMHATPEEAGH
jgi:hydroxymethylpyrimidine/phosphomethylpyrimidine kinase